MKRNIFLKKIKYSIQFVILLIYILYNIKDLYKRINIIDDDKSLSDKKSIVSYCVNFIDREFENFLSFNVKWKKLK
mgnify:CR=1 FL=1